MNHMGYDTKCNHQKENKEKGSNKYPESWTGKEKSHKNILQGVRDKSSK